MIPASPSARWLDRLDQLQRLFDGPIPAPDRRWIFADPDLAVRSASETWSDLARESAERTDRLRRILRAAPTSRPRRAATDALDVEIAWGRHCLARGRTACEPSAIAHAAVA